MTIPNSELDIVQMLNLEMYGQQYPAPNFGSIAENVVVLNGMGYSEQAINEGIASLDATLLRELFQYGGKIFSHNNVAGHGGSGADLNIFTTFSYLPEEQKQRIKNAIKKE